MSCLLSIWFALQILDSDPDCQELHVKFLRCRGTYYSFPDVEEAIAWIGFTQVVETLDHPQISLRDQYSFN